MFADVVTEEEVEKVEEKEKDALTKGKGERGRARRVGGQERECTYLRVYV